MSGSPSIWAHQGGNTAMVFGLAILPILALSGGAVDLSHRADVRMKVQSASDTAALAAARKIQSGRKSNDQNMDELKASATEIARSVFTAALADTQSASLEPIIEFTGGAVKVSADVDVDTSFLTLLGINKLRADGHAEVSIPDPTPVEIALVLDYSKSMLANSKYARMTAAAQEFISKVGIDRGDTTKIGIVPFSEYVYATLPGADVRGLGLADANAAVTACFSNRGYPSSTTANTPSPTDEATRWPQTAESDPKCQTYAANGMQVRELSNDFSGLNTALAAMTPVGKTNISLATELGWHVLTRDAPFETAAPYSKKSVKKVMILLTDGVQTVAAEGPGGDTSTGGANATTAELCANIKQTGITVYTIAYDVDDTSVYSLLSGCASDPNAYYEVHDSSGIDSVFDEIYSRMTASLWLSR